MPRERFIASLALAAAALAVASACGGAESIQPLTKPEYEQQAGAILRAYAAAPKRTEVFTPETLGRDTTAAADELDRLSAPRDVRKLHGRLVGALRRLADDEKRLGDAIYGDPDDFQRALDDLTASRAARDAAAALRAFRDRGYRLPSLFGARNVGPLPGPAVAA